MLAHSSSAEHALLFATGICAVLIYGLGWLRRPKASTAPLAAWITAVVVAMLATTPTVEEWAHRSFTGHMVQHLALIVIVAPLAVLAQPILTLRHAPLVGHQPRPTSRSVSRWWRRYAAIAAPTIFLGVLLLTHLTDIYELALDNRLVHHIEHAAYLGSAVALWSAILAPGRRSAVTRVGAAFAVIAGSALLGAILISATEPLVPTYVEGLGPEEALNDQRHAASLMWAGGMGTTLPLLLTSVWVWAAAEQRITERTEELEDGRTRSAPRERSSVDPHVRNS